MNELAAGITIMALPTENDVIDTIAGFPRGSGWEVTQSCDTRHTGVDLVASHPISGHELYIEAKGATSSKPESKRYGRVLHPRKSGIMWQTYSMRQLGS